MSKKLINLKGKKIGGILHETRTNGATYIHFLDENLSPIFMVSEVHLFDEDGNYFEYDRVERGHGLIDDIK